MRAEVWGQREGQFDPTLNISERCSQLTEQHERTSIYSQFSEATGVAASWECPGADPRGHLSDISVHLMRSARSRLAILERLKTCVVLGAASEARITL